jgi:hypothetical protein
VKRISAGLNQAEDAVEAALTARNLKTRSRYDPECGYTGDVSEVKVDELFVVGNVEKGGGRVNDAVISASKPWSGHASQRPFSWP